MTAAEADRIYSLRARGLNAAAIAEHASLDVATVQGVLNPAIQHKELDDLDETRQVLDDLRHAAADLIRRWNAAYPSEAAESPQIGSQTTGKGVVPLAHENPPKAVFSTTEPTP
jgi:hypothetical protein